MECTCHVNTKAIRHDYLFLPGVGDVIMDTTTVNYNIFGVYECKLQPSVQVSFFPLLFIARHLEVIQLFWLWWSGMTMPGLWGFTCVVVEDSSPWFNADPQVTSQQAWLPALTPGNMKITETIKHVWRHPSVAEGQSLLTFATASHYVFI